LDIERLFGKELILVLLAIGCFALYYFLRELFRSLTRSFKGSVGESRVARRLGRLNRDEHKVFNDIIIKSNNKSCQIDHVVVSIYGIYVIETKHYKGWIHGHENSEYWTQTFYRSKTKFNNPIRQNKGHIYALKGVLSEFLGIQYHPIIVFSGSATLKNVYTETPVIYVHQLIRTLKEKRNNPHISTKQVEYIANKLKTVMANDGTARKHHARQVRAQVSIRKKKEKALICPRCDHALLLRRGQYGKFYGCANFPVCTYSRNK
jgi:hypothetical protein